jgi:hypothetical protein
MPTVQREEPTYPRTLEHLNQQLAPVALAHEIPPLSIRNPRAAISELTEGQLQQIERCLSSPAMNSRK